MGVSYDGKCKKRKHLDFSPDEESLKALFAESDDHSITKALFMSKELSESLAKDRATKKKHKTKISCKNCCPRTEAGWQGGTMEEISIVCQRFIT